MTGAVTYLVLAVAGGVGAVARNELGRWIDRSTRFVGPVGIFTVNVLASAAVGAVSGAGLVGAQLVPELEWLGIVLASGLLGGFSTLSTVATDTAKLVENRRWGWVVLNTFGMLAVAGLACWGATAVGGLVRLAG